MVILCKRQNQKSSRAKTFKRSFGLPLLTMTSRFMASTCKTTNCPLHLSKSACKHRLTPSNSRYVEDYMASHAEKYSRATKVTPLKVCPPHLISLATVATFIESRDEEGQISYSNLSQGRSFQKWSSLRAPSPIVIQQLGDNTLLRM